MGLIKRFKRWGHRLAHHELTRLSNGRWHKAVASVDLIVAHPIDMARRAFGIGVALQEKWITTDQTGDWHKITPAGLEAWKQGVGR